jgi:hypothetical protein
MQISILLALAAVLVGLEADARFHLDPSRTVNTNGLKLKQATRKDIITRSRTDRVRRQQPSPSVDNVCYGSGPVGVGVVFASFATGAWYGVSVDFFTRMVSKPGCALC